MGLLTAFADGASRGLSVLGDGMLRGIERDAEQGIWEKRQALLQQIARENRQADFDFRNDPKNVQTEIGTATTKAEAAGATARSEAVKGLTDPALIAAKDQDAAKQAQREIDAATTKLRDPNLTAAQRETAQREVEQAKARIQALAPAEAKRAGMIAGAQASAQAGAKEGPDLSTKFASIENAIGRSLSQQEKEALAGLGKAQGSDPNAKAAFESVLKRYESGELKAEDAGAELNTILTSVKAGPQVSALKDAVAQARSDGKVAGLVADLKARQFSPERLKALGLTDDEIKAAPPSPQERKGTGMLSSSPAAAPRDVIGNQPIGPLTRQADIEESARAGNKRAIEYLKRQEQGRIENQTAPRDAASLMNG